MGLVLMGDAAASGKKAPAGTAHQYGFTLLVSTLHFAAWGIMLFAPQVYAQHVLGYTGASASLLTYIRLERSALLWSMMG